MATFASRGYEPPPSYDVAFSQPASQGFRSHGEPSAPLLPPRVAQPAYHQNQTPQVVPQSPPPYNPNVAGGGAGGAATQLPRLERHRIEAFNVTKFIMLWSGVGRCICIPCFLIYILFLAFGVFIVERAINFTIESDTTSVSSSIFILCIISGLMFVILCAYWCCVAFMIRGFSIRTITDCCTRSSLNQQQNYGSVTCASWIISILFVSVATALLMNILNDDWSAYDDEFCGVLDLFCLEVVIAITMWTLIGLFTCCNVCCYFVCIRQLAGQICGKDETQS